jgi:TetR/AcrR family transcriptional repressor of nem operon
MGRVSDAKERLMEAVKVLMWTGSYGSTTIDQICEKAGVKKGSFYYFFDSKAELAETALNEDWQRHRAELDSIFSATIPPLERLRKYCEMGYKIQAEMHAKHGAVLGCPLFCVGSEVSTQEDRLQKKIQEILEYKRKYLESVIREAHGAGLIHAPDAAAKSRALLAYYQGILTQARIQNDLGVIREAHRAILDFLGVKDAELAPAA